MPGSSTTPGRPGARACAPDRVAFHYLNSVGTRDLNLFRGSMAGLCAPLPTLRRRPRGRPRTARGRCGSLLLHRVGLAPSTPCRSPGALRKILYVIRSTGVSLLKSRPRSAAVFIDEFDSGALRSAPTSQAFHSRRALDLGFGAPNRISGRSAGEPANSTRPASTVTVIFFIRGRRQAASGLQCSPSYSCA